MGSIQPSERTRPVKKGAERRESERRELDEEVFCYIESTRCDARTKDISAGGMFLASEEEVPLGSLVAMVFRFQASVGNAPVFLMGRVVRQQGPPNPGAGLRWEKAVCAGPPIQLALFLRSTLGVAPDGIIQRPMGRNQEMKSLFAFDPGLDLEPAPRSTGTKPGLRTAESSPGLDRLGKTESRRRSLESKKNAESLREAAREIGPSELELARGDAERQKTSFAIPTHPPRPSQSFDGPGPLTVRTDSDVRAPADLKATITYNDQSISGRVSHLGTTGMFVNTCFVPVKKVAKVTVDFEILTRDGPAAVGCICRLAAIDDGSLTNNPGVDLEILQADEGKHAGLIRRYVKWLHYRSLEGE